MSEIYWTREIIKLARQLGLLVHHCDDSRRCSGQPGFPDLVIAGRKGVIFAEIKSDDGETSADQDMWGWTIGQPGRQAARMQSPPFEGERHKRAGTGIIPGHAPVCYRVWRPLNVISGRVRDELEALC